MKKNLRATRRQIHLSDIGWGKKGVGGGSSDDGADGRPLEAAAVVGLDRGDLPLAVLHQVAPGPVGVVGVVVVVVGAAGAGVGGAVGGAGHEGGGGGGGVEPVLLPLRLDRRPRLHPDAGAAAAAAALVCGLTKKCSETLLLISRRVSAVLESSQR